jgi:hypothetical protein
MNSNSLQPQKIIFYPPIVQNIKLNKFTVSVNEITLFTSCTLSVILYDTEDRPYDNRIYKLEGQDYLSWNTDDKYITDYVKSQLQQESQNQ